MENLPFSNSAIRRLGSRLRRGDATDADRFLLIEWIRAHDGPMKHVSLVLREELDLPNTSRLKTAGTLQDKLRRDQSNLFTMDDIAGVRLEPVADRVEQDAVVARIVERFPDCRTKDRRMSPNAGYRAAHVIVRISVYRVEVQVRTQAQHSWAEANEKLADLVGRGIRYGNVPPDPLIGELHKALMERPTPWTGRRSTRPR